MLRPARIRLYLDIMQERGFAPSQTLAGTGIDAKRLSDADYLIDKSQCQRTILNMLALSGDGGIGFDTGAQTEASDLGLIGYAILSCGTMRQTLNLWSQYSAALLGILSRLALAEATGGLVVRVVEPRQADPLSMFCAEEILSMMYKFGGLLARGEQVVRSLSFAYPAPAHSQRYHDFFQCPIQFGAEETSAVLASEWLDRPLRTKDEEFNHICVAHCGRILHQIQHTGPVVSRIRSLLLATPRAVPSLDEAAAKLGLTSRTLRRHLLAEGASYRTLVEEFRADLAREYLRTMRLSTKEVAFLLGYQDTAAFRRAFRQWTGRTPGEFRDGSIEADADG
jgi:AraC-like DNA-binding protein